MEQQFPVKRKPAPLRLSSVPFNPSPLHRSPFDDWYPPPQQQQQSPQQHLLLHRQHHASISPIATSDSSHLEEAMWKMTLQSAEEMDFATGPYPERPGEPDCLYYIRTGLCGYGMSCRFNHPPNRKLAAALSRDRGEYPERVGQPECQHYLKTATCKFGSTCKFHHPKERAGLLGRVTLNIVGLPLRLGEKDCAYYMRTGSCKFGATCKFNHPQPTTFGPLVAMSGSSVYASVGFPSAPSPQSFPAGVPSWTIARTAYMSGSRFQNPPSFAPVIVPPQGLVSMPTWSTYQARMGPMAPLEVQQQALGGSFVYGAAAPTDAVSGGVHSSYNPYMQGSATGFPSMQVQSSSLSNDSSFPERSGMPECQYYIKTGDCKFGMSCRYHHPRERISSMQTAILSPIGLPLRPGVPVCTFYTRYGICKFGPTCKFDHPMSNLAYSPSASSLVDMPIAPYPAGSSVAAILPSSSETAIPGPTSILIESTGASEVQGEYESSYINGRTNDIASDVPAANATNQSSNPESSELRGT